nr:hypothetical protein [Mucilaginibacter sp. X5P1]
MNLHIPSVSLYALFKDKKLIVRRLVLKNFDCTIFCQYSFVFFAVAAFTVQGI